MWTLGAFMLRAAISVILLALAFPTAGQAYSGLELLRGCTAILAPERPTDTDAVVGMFRCSGYLAGIVDANAIVSGMRGKPAALFCLPDTGLENEQVIRIVVKYLNDHPEHLHEQARMGAIIALRLAFPCPP